MSYSLGYGSIKSLIVGASGINPKSFLFPESRGGGENKSP